MMPLGPADEHITVSTKMVMEKVCFILWAVVLAQHPELTQPLSNPPKPLVIFAFMNYGKGRTFFSAVDNTWRWRAGVDNLHFYRFWGQVCRFVAAGRLLGKTPRFTITSDKEVYSIGESVGVEAQVYDANMNPSVDETISVYHQVQEESRSGFHGDAKLQPHENIFLYPTEEELNQDESAHRDQEKTEPGMPSLLKDFIDEDL